MQGSIAWHWMPRFRINGCAHGSRIAWLVMPRFESMAARMAAACRLAHGASLEPVAACNAASLGTNALLQDQWLRTWQRRCLARDASLRIDGCTHGVSIAWHMDGATLHINGCASQAAASRGTQVVPRFKSMTARTTSASRGKGMVPRFTSMAARHARRQHRVAHR